MVASGLGRRVRMASDRELDNNSLCNAQDDLKRIQFIRENDLSFLCFCFFKQEMSILHLVQDK